MMRAAWLRHPIRVAFPLALRHLRRRWTNTLLIALSLTLGISASVLLSGLAGSGADTVRVLPLSLPADIVLESIGEPAGVAISQSMWDRLDHAADFSVVERAVALPVFTPVGQARLVGLPPAMLARLAPGSSRPAGVWLPRRMADAAGTRIGDEFVIAALTSRGEWRQKSLWVAGVFTGDDYLTGPVVTRETALDFGVASGDNVALVIVESNSVIDEALGRARLLHDYFRVLTATYPTDHAAKLFSRILSPGNAVVQLVFALSGLGMANILLLSFLQRKKQMGVLKALGLTDRDLRWLFLGEGLFMVVLGGACGAAAAQVLAWGAGRALGVAVHVSSGAVLRALVFAAVTFAAAAYLPATLCRRAPVSTLLQNKRVYLDPKSGCVQCGRCGGF
jgi:hypothetical protein